jgi:hypothetical protein
VTNIDRTPLVGRNRLTCDECGDDLGGTDRLPRTVRWGFWDDATQSFEGAAREEHYCEPCWRDEFDRAAAAHYEVTDAERFWGVLAAADGRLVADLGPMFVGGHPWIRVVDGGLQALNATRTAREEGDRRVIKFGVEQSDADREWFDETFENAGDAEQPALALLKPAEETPFAEFEYVDDDQQRLTEEA